MTAVIDAKAFARIKSYIDYAKLNHRIVAGGTYDDSIGYYVQPTIVEVDKPNDRLMTEVSNGALSFS